MKFKITMKDPDGVYECVQEAIVKSLPDGLTAAERDMLKESRQDTFSEYMRRWFQFGEYITVEIDTDAKTCTVCEVER